MVNHLTRSLDRKGLSISSKPPVTNPTIIKEWGLKIGIANYLTRSLHRKGLFINSIPWKMGTLCTS